MDLRYRLAVVTGGGGAPGREAAVALSRRGAAVLVADRDLAGAEETANLVHAARVRACVLQVDLVDDLELQLLIGRARDLGGADLLVTADGAASRPVPLDVPPVAWAAALDRHLHVPVRLAQLLVPPVADRRRRDGTSAVVHVAPAGDAPELAAAAGGLAGFTRSLAQRSGTEDARVMCVVQGPPARAPATSGIAAQTPVPSRLPPGGVGEVVVELLSRGSAGQVVELPRD